jgi:cob(I)alamin adenosyltransferase
VSFYTKKGDDGSTGLLFGGRVRKDAPAPRAYGAADEAQAAFGLARAEAEPGGELDSILLAVERDLYVLMAELATAPENRRKLVAGQTLVTPEMVAEVERLTDEVAGRDAPRLRAAGCQPRVGRPRAGPHGRPPG